VKALVALKMSGNCQQNMQQTKQPELQIFLLIISGQYMPKRVPKTERSYFSLTSVLSIPNAQVI